MSATSVEVGDEIWVIGCWGPKVAKFNSVWPAKKACVIDCQGTPEVVSIEDCFSTQLACYREAAVRETRKAMQALSQAQKYNEVAKELEGKPAKSGEE
jgi:hypothetical protein